MSTVGSGAENGSRDVKSRVRDVRRRHSTRRKKAVRNVCTWGPAACRVAPCICCIIRNGTQRSAACVCVSGQTRPGRQHIRVAAAQGLHRYNALNGEWGSRCHPRAHPSHHAILRQAATHPAPMTNGATTPLSRPRAAFEEKDECLLQLLPPRPPRGFAPASTGSASRSKSAE